MHAHLPKTSPRPKHLLRKTLLVTTPLLALLTLRLFWGYHADHRLQTLEADLIKKGFHLHPTAPAVPDDQNAALALIDALNAIDLHDSDPNLVYTDGSRSDADITWTDSQKPDITAILDRNAAAFNHLKRAQQKTAINWPITSANFASPMDRSRSLSCLLYDHAVLAHDDHRETQCLIDLALILSLAQIIDADPCQSSHDVANAIRHLAAEGIERFQPSLTLSPNDGSLDAARSLLTLFEVASHEGDRRLLAFESDIANPLLAPQTYMHPFWQWWFRPLCIDETSRLLTIDASEAPSVRADTWPATVANLPPRPESQPSLLAFLTRFASRARSDGPLTAQPSRQHFSTRTACAAATLLLAAAIHRAETGHYPATPAELIPRTLTRLPIDPFTPDYRPMAYRLDPDGPTVWSVGQDANDDGGIVPLRPDGTRGARYYKPAHNPPPFDITYGAARRAIPITPPPAPPPPDPPTE